MNKRDITELTWITVDQLKKNPTNPRILRDPKGKEKLVKAIKDHGFRNPLDTWLDKDGKYLILVGNNRYDAGLVNGMVKFPCFIYEGSKKKAMARALNDNKSDDWTEWNMPVLVEQLMELDHEFDMSLTGFDETELENLFAEVPEFKEFDESVEDEVKYIECPSCGHKFPK